MKRAGKERLALVVTFTSFALIWLMLYVASLLDRSYLYVWVALTFFFVLLWIVSALAAITYSRKGWAVSGSALEWIVAAILDLPFALILYFTGKDRER